MELLKKQSISVFYTFLPKDENRGALAFPKRADELPDYLQNPKCSGELVIPVHE